MPPLLRLEDGRPVVTNDPMSWIEDRETSLDALPEGPVLVPLALWLAEAVALRARTAPIGVWIAADEEVESLEGHLDGLATIGVHFPAFSDGRGLSTAVLLRTRLGWAGEIRALGDVQRDQLQHMRRCGIDAFAVRADLDPHAAAAGLDVMSLAYQGDADDARPLHRRTERGAEVAPEVRAA